MRAVAGIVCPRMERMMPQFERITQTAGVMGGKPCIRGLRVTVGMVVGQIAAGRGIDAFSPIIPI